MLVLPTLTQRLLNRKKKKRKKLTYRPMSSTPVTNNPKNLRMFGQLLGKSCLPSVPNGQIPRFGRRAELCAVVYRRSDLLASASVR